LDHQFRHQQHAGGFKRRPSELRYLAADALNRRIGSNPAALTASETLQFRLMESALFNQPIGTDPTLAPAGLTSVAAIPLVVTPGSGGSIVGFAGGIAVASTLTEIFLLEYCDGKALKDIAWGRLTKEQIQQVVQLHDLDFDKTDRTSYLAQTQGWQLPSFAQNDTPPGGGLVYELRQRPDSSYVVRIYYISQTMDQMHDATPLTLESGPCPLADFNAIVDRVGGIPFNN
jgi:4-phytase/acid phosphatase